MSGQSDKAIPPPLETDNVFLQIAFSERPESEKTRDITALIDPGKNFETAPRGNVMQQLEYAKGYLSGATPRAHAEKEAYVKKLKDENMFFMVAFSGKADERVLKIFEPKLKDADALMGSDELLAYEKRLRDYQFLRGYLEGEKALKRSLGHCFNAAAMPDTSSDPVTAKPQLAPEQTLSERGPRAQDYLRHLRMYFY